MIIDLTDAFNALHHFWDALGVILLGLIVVYIPIVVVLASTIKAKELIKSKSNKPS